jgi:hypothetical protein
MQGLRVQPLEEPEISRSTAADGCRRRGGLSVPRSRPMKASGTVIGHDRNAADLGAVDLAKPAGADRDQEDQDQKGYHAEKDTAEAIGSVFARARRRHGLVVAPVASSAQAR